MSEPTEKEIRVAREMEKLLSQAMDADLGFEEEDFRTDTIICLLARIAVENATNRTLLTDIRDYLMDDTPDEPWKT